MHPLVEQRLDADTVRALASGSVVTVGNFDGVHLGHRALIDATVAEATERGLPSVALTFEPHPVTVFRGIAPSEFRLTRSDERAALLRAAGIDHVVTVAFDKDFAGLTPEEFVAGLLWEGLRARSVHVGYDFNFGRGRAGNIDSLRAVGEPLGMVARDHGAVEYRGEPISSTRVRNAIRAGEVEQARHLLDRPYRLTGVSEHGAGRGKKVGIPTVNLYPTGRLLPPLGVYATRLVHDGQTHASITNIGRRPTFDDDDRVSVETMVLGPFDDDVHGQDVAVDLLGFIRPERAFEHAEALRRQIDSDVETAREIHARREER